MTLKMGSPSLSDDMPDTTPQQERSLALEQNTANLGGLESKIGEGLTVNGVLEKFPEETRDVIKGALIKECYLQWGENAIIKDIKVHHDFKNDETEIRVGMATLFHTQFL